MNGTVYLFTPFGEAAKAFLTARGCQPRATDGTQYAAGYAAGQEDIALRFAGLRKSTSRENLRDLVRAAQDAGADADALTIAVGLVAGARLLELETQGKQPPAFRPGEAGPR